VDELAIFQVLQRPVQVLPGALLLDVGVLVGDGSCQRFVVGEADRGRSWGLLSKVFIDRGE
jgi:hypothetical protein